MSDLNPMAEPSRRLNLLLVEDDRASLRVLTKLLEHCGHNVHSARTLAEANALASERDSLDAIVTDLSLPDGDGWALLESLGERLPRARIVMSGFGESSDHARSQSLGAVHLTKPVDCDLLNQTLLKVTAETQSVSE